MMLGILIVVAIQSVSAVSDNYVSKIVPTPTDAPVLYGTLSGSIRCGYNTLTKEVGIKNDADLLNEFHYFPIRPDGTFEEQLIPGNFTLYLKDGDGGQPETSHAVIVAGKTSQPMNELKGHAVSPKTDEIKAKPTPIPTPTCHEHRIWIPGYYEPRETCDKRHHCHTEWVYVPGYWYTWTCCQHHCGLEVN